MSRRRVVLYIAVFLIWVVAGYAIITTIRPDTDKPAAVYTVQIAPTYYGIPETIDDEAGLLQTESALERAQTDISESLDDSILTPDVDAML